RPVAALLIRRAMTDRILHAPPDLDLFTRDQPRLDDAFPRRINADPETLERVLAQLVLTIVELLRQLMERQGHTFMELDKRMVELRDSFGLDEEDLNLNLGPLGNLL